MVRAIEKKILELEKELLTQDSNTTKLASNSLSMLSTDPLQEKYTDSFPNLINIESFVNEQSTGGLGADSEFLLFSNLSTDPLQEKYTDSFPNLMNTEDLLVNEQSTKVLGLDSELLLFSN